MSPPRSRFPTTVTSLIRAASPCMVDRRSCSKKPLSVAPIWACRTRARSLMKAPNFRYIRPTSLEHAYRILAESEDAVPVAGGQSLLAGLNMRLSAPKLLVDIGDLKDLAVSSESDGEVRLGALTRHCDLLQSDMIRKRLPLLAQAASHIGHVAIRTRGTLGGSLAYADPAAELPACSVALGATIVLGSLAGTREVKA